MEYFKQLFQGIYELMLNVDVPLFGQTFPLWAIFLFGTLGSIFVWFILKFFR